MLWHGSPGRRSAGKEITEPHEGVGQKKKGKNKPNPLKANNINDLETELQRISESNKKHPASGMKNKENGIIYIGNLE